MADRRGKSAAVYLECTPETRELWDTLLAGLREDRKTPSLSQSQVFEWLVRDALERWRSGERL